MAVVLKKKEKAIVDGRRVDGPLLAGPEGLSIGKRKVEKVSLLKKRVTIVPDVYLLRWADVIDYKIEQPQNRQFAGSTLNANDVLLTFRTANTVKAFTLHGTNPTRVTNQLGSILATIDAKK